MNWYRKKIVLIHFFFILFLFSSTIGAQQNLNIDYEPTCSELGLCHSPYHAFTWKNEKRFIIPSLAISSAGLILNATNTKKSIGVDEIMMLNSNDINSLDRKAIFNNSKGAADISDLFEIGITFAPIVFFADKHTRHDFGRIIGIYVEGLAITGGSVFIIKNIVHRPRPFTYNTDISIEDRVKSTNNQSFLSGHTAHVSAASFMMRQILLDYHPDMSSSGKAGLLVLATSIPAITGYLRVKAGKHYFSDVAAGYALGALVGNLLPRLHRIDIKDSALRIDPGIDGIQITLQF